MSDTDGHPANDIKSDARFAYEGLERVIHEKARLGILASLSAHEGGLAFSELKQLCALTDGNLNRHLLVLQDAGLVDVHKRTDSARPQTVCHVTPLGRERFSEYISVLERVVQDAVDARTATTAAKRTSEGFSTA